MIKKILLPAIIVTIVIILVSFLPASESKPLPNVQPTTEVKEEALPQTPIEAGLPVRLIIPSINVDAGFQYVGLAPDGSMGAPEGAFDVGWYNLGPKPGEKGSAIITGHYGQWRAGYGSVFDNLEKLKEGDKIYIKDDKGNTMTFMVERSQNYDRNESVPDLFNRDDDAYLNLITCNGTWIKELKTYSNRLVVYTKIVK